MDAVVYTIFAMFALLLLSTLIVLNVLMQAVLSVTTGVVPFPATVSGQVASAIIVSYLSNVAVSSVTTPVATNSLNILKVEQFVGPLLPSRFKFTLLFRYKYSHLVDR